MPSSPVVISTNQTTQAVKATFVDTYNQVRDADQALGTIMAMDLPSTGDTETYAYWESAGHPVRQPRGTDVSRIGFRGVGWTTTNYTWSRAIDWHRDDEADDKTESLLRRTEDLAKNFALLPWRAFFQIVRAATDPDLLPGIPNAPDGAALFSATDGGGAARFGATGGNIITGTGVTNESQIISNFYSAVTRMLQFQDTQGEELYDDAILRQRGLVVVFNIANTERFHRAFYGDTASVIIQNVAATENVATAAPTNPISKTGYRVTLLGSAKLTDNDWSVWLQNAAEAAVYRQVREDLELLHQDESNSDIARQSGNRAITARARYGFGVGPAYSVVQVNN